MPNPLWTRAQYLADECSFRAYYAQFVTDHTKRAVLRSISLDRLRAAYAEDQSFNLIPLAKWDMISRAAISPADQRKMKACGDFITLAGAVCIVKEAARQIIEESQS